MFTLLTYTLGVHVQSTCDAVSLLLDNTTFAKHFDNNVCSTDDLVRWIGMIDCLRKDATVVIVEMKLYTGFVVNAISSRSVTVHQFFATANNMGSQMDAKFRRILSMKTHWMIVKLRFQ